MNEELYLIVGVIIGFSVGCAITLIVQMLDKNEVK